MFAPSLKENEIQVPIIDPSETLHARQREEEEKLRKEQEEKLRKDQEDSVDGSQDTAGTEEETEQFPKLPFLVRVFNGNESDWVEPCIQHGCLFRRDGNTFAKTIYGKEVLLKNGDIVAFGTENHILSVLSVFYKEKEPVAEKKRENPSVGEVWRHHNGKDYQIITVAMNHGGQKQYVIYKEFKTDGPVWSRELDNFMGTKKGDSSVYRFELVGRAAVDFGTGETILVPSK